MEKMNILTTSISVDSQISFLVINRRLIHYQILSLLKYEHNKYIVYNNKKQINILAFMIKNSMRNVCVCGHNYVSANCRK